MELDLCCCHLAVLHIKPVCASGSAVGNATQPKSPKNKIPKNSGQKDTRQEGREEREQQKRVPCGTLANHEKDQKIRLCVNVQVFQKRHVPAPEHSPDRATFEMLCVS